MTRIACFFVPMFPLAARLRSEPELIQEAVAIVEGNGNNAHVTAATRRARKKGIRPGLSLAQARSRLFCGRPEFIALGLGRSSPRPWRRHHTGARALTPSSSPACSFSTHYSRCCCACA